LLGVRVFLRARYRAILTELEAAVDPVARAERCREEQARLERRPPALLEIRVKNVGRIREQVRPQVLANVRRSELRKVVEDLRLRIAPGEVRVRLREADLREIPHQLGPRE